MYLAGALGLTLWGVAVSSAIDWYGQPMAGVLVGYDAVVSNSTPPSWDGPRQGLSYPDRIVGVEGERLESLPLNERGRRLNQVAKQVADSGRSTLTLDVQQGPRLTRKRIAIERLAGASWWLLAGSLFFAGVLLLFAGLLALWASPRGRLPRSFASCACMTAVFCLTLFDFHTGYRLVPLFLITLAILPGAVCMFALRLPDDAIILRRIPWLGRVTLFLGIAVAFHFTVPFVSRQAMPPLYKPWASSVLGGSMLFFVLTFAVRYVRATGHRRDLLRALAGATVMSLPAVGLGLVAMPLHGRILNVSVLFYPVLSLIPIAIAFAFVRYDLWGSRVLLSRVLTRLAVGAVACLAGIAAGIAVAAAIGVPFRSAVIAAVVSGLVAAILVLLALHAAEVYVFPSRAQYKPTVEQLSADLISITSPEEVARAIERTVAHWLPCEHIKLVLNAEVRVPALNVTGVAADYPLTHEILVPPAASGDELILPVVFRAQHLGTLELGAKPGGALFTSEDLDLLGTVINQGALALAHACAYQELEQRRKQQAAAWRGEREALVQTVAAEVSHEIRYPLNFFRSLFGRAESRPLLPEDLEVGREEVERLERLVGDLQRMTAHRLQRQATTVRALCARAEVLLQDLLGTRRLVFTGDGEMTVLCDPNQMTQILVNLLANALQATLERGQVGVAWQLWNGGARIQVWDDGAGFAGDPAALFAPWYTTKERGTGLGLAIAHRLVRAHGWTIAATREGERTLFTVDVPRTDLVCSPEESLEQWELQVS